MKLSYAAARLSRRQFVYATAGWLAASNSSEPLRALHAAELESTPAPAPNDDYGPLIPVADDATGPVVTETAGRISLYHVWLVSGPHVG